MRNGMHRRRMERNKTDVYKLHNGLKVTSPLTDGGLALHQMFWAHRFVTLTLTTLRAKSDMLLHDLQMALPAKRCPFTTICQYSVS